MAKVTKTRTYSSGDTLTADNYNDDRDEEIAGINSITNAQVAAAAAIAVTKIANTAVDLSSTQTISGTKTFSGTNTFSGANTFSETNTFSAHQVYSKATKQSLETDTDGATITFDLDEANIHTVTLEGNRTLALDNADTGQCFIIRLVQDGTGSRTVTWFTTIKWDNSTAPTLTTTASKVDVFGFICTGANTYDGYIVAQNVG